MILELKDVSFKLKCILHELLHRLCRNSLNDERRIINVIYNLIRLQDFLSF